MKVVYLIGPYRDKRGAWYIDQNIQAAKNVSAQLWGSGFAVICPHANTAHFDGAASDEQFLEGLIEIMCRTDCVYVLPGWENSSGSLAEINEARIRGIPVYFYPEQMPLL